jgi:hypothetical protein
LGIRRSSSAASSSWFPALLSSASRHAALACSIVAVRSRPSRNRVVATPVSAGSSATTSSRRTLCSPSESAAAVRDAPPECRLSPERCFLA